MSSNLTKPDLPSYVVAHPLLVVDDVSKVDKRLLKVYRGTINLNHAFLATDGCIDIFEDMPTVQELIEITSSGTFDYDTDLATPYPRLHALATYFLQDEATAFPANFPTRFAFLYRFNVTEKVMMVKSAWRTRSYHAMVPQFCAAMQLVIIFAFADIYSIMISKARKISATAFPDSQLQIPFIAKDSSTWKAYLYRTVFDINNVYTATQRENMLNHLWLTLDTYNFVIPEESRKLGRLLVGKFNNPVFDDQLDVIYDYPIDLLATESTFDDVVFGTDWGATIHPLLVKLQSYMTSVDLIYEKFEYNDRFYSQSFGAFKEMLTPVKFESKDLSDWQELTVPWFQIYYGWHYDGGSFRNELIARGWNASNLAADHTIDVDNGQTEDFFTRDHAGLDVGEDMQTFIYAILPYGYDEEQWKLGLSFGWMYLSQFMGGNLLPDDLEHDFDFDVTYNHLTYYEYYDNDENLIYQVAVEITQPGDDTILGWVSPTDTAIVNDLYKLRQRDSGEYEPINEDLTELDINGLVWDPNNNTFLYPRLLRLFPHLARQHSYFQATLFKEYIYKLVNPRIAPPQKQPPSVNEKSDASDTLPPVVVDVKKNLESDTEKILDKKQKLEDNVKFQKDTEKDSSISEAEIEKIDKELQQSNTKKKNAPSPDEKTLGEEQ